MNPAQKGAIRRQYVYLVDNLTDPRSTGLADHLYQDEVIELEDRQTLENKPATPGAIRHLLDAVMNSKKTDAFDYFLQCLEKCGQGYLANSIKQNINSDGTGLCEICPDNIFPAVSVCIVCNQLMCTACVRSHKKTRVTMDHRFKDLGTALSTKCDQHPSFYLKSYCSKCDALICEQCMVDTHKDHADTWKDATTAAEELRNQLKELVHKIGKMTVNEITMEEETQIRLTDLENSKRIAARSIEKRRKELHHLVDDAAAKAKGDLEKTYHVIKLRLQTTRQIKTIKKHLRAYDKLIHDAQAANVVKHHSEWSASLNEMLHTPSSVPIVPNLSFQTTTWPKTMGVLVVDEITPLVSQFKIQCSEDPKESPMVVDSMPGGDIVVGTLCFADKTKRRIIISSPSGEIKQEIQVSGLRGLTALRDGTIAATVRDGSTQEVRIYTKDGKVASSFKCNNASFVTVNHEGHLVVIDDMKEETDHTVTVYSRSGEQIRAFTDTSAKPMEYSKYVATAPSGDIIVSDPNDCCIRVYTPEGQLRYTYGGEGVMETTCGACVDEDGNIFITDVHANNIHQVSPTSQYIRHVLTDKDGLWASDVCMNHQGHLVVAQEDGRIKTYKYK